MNNNPIRYIDPSGHRCVGNSGECANDNGKPINGAGERLRLSKRAKQLVDFSKSVGLTPEDVIGIGLGHEMFGEAEYERELHMQAYRNGFLRYANEHCSGNASYTCMLNYFAGSYESVYNQFLSKESGYTKQTTFWGKPKEYLYVQYAYIRPGNKVLSNLSSNYQGIVKSGIEFMGNFMDTISDFSYDPELPLNTGVVNAAAFSKALRGYSPADNGFLVVISVTCPNTGVNGYSLIYNLKGEQTLGAAGITDC